MICSKCGADNADTSRFCTKCGSALDSAPAAIYPPADMSAPVQSDTTPPAPLYTQPTQQGYTNYTSSNYGGAPLQSDNGWLGIAALVCGILSIPCCFTIYGGFVFGIAAVVMGIFGLKTSRRSLAIAGIVCGGVGILFSIFYIVAAFAGFEMLQNNP